MIIHYNHNKPTNVYVVNSRSPVYKAYYGDGIGVIIAGLFTRMVPKVAPLAKQLSMKAIDVIHDKGISTVRDLAGKAFSAAKNQIISLVQGRSRQRNSKNFQQPVVWPSTTVMPANVSKAINSAVEQKLASLAAAPLTAPSMMTPSLTDAQSNAIVNMKAGSGLKPRSWR